jgi:6-O-methylguanine DNA methyltransferase, DNA binding domain
MSGKSYKRKSWREKLADSKGLPKVGQVTGRMTAKWGAGTMVVPAPMEVDELMRRAPKGRVTTISQLRETLARKHRVNFACPITTGIFAWIAAHAAEEAAAEGRKRITPYWRTLKSTGELNEKYPGGAAAQARHLRAEGLSIEPGKGKKPSKVKDFEEHIFSVSQESRLAKYAGKDLKKLSERALKEFTDDFEHTTGEKVKADGRTPKPWLLEQIDKLNGTWLLLKVYPGFEIPDCSFVEAHLFDDHWKRRGKVVIPTGYRMFIKEAKIISGPVVSENLLVIKTTSAVPFSMEGGKKRPLFEPGDYQLQYYGLVGGKLELVRLTDDRGRVIPNSYRWNIPLKGPEVPKLSKNDWVQKLSSTDRVSALSVLVWLSGAHMPSTEHRQADVNQESVADSKIFESVRDAAETKQILSKLTDSEIVWVREYAKLAINRERND